MKGTLRLWMGSVEEQTPSPAMPMHLPVVIRQTNLTFTGLLKPFTKPPYHRHHPSPTSSSLTPLPLP
ncbi:unnamed protein product [Lota lota]